MEHPLRSRFATMRISKLLPVAAIVMLSHMACVAPTGSDEATDRSQDNLADNAGGVTEGPGEADRPSKESVVAGKSLAAGMVEPNLTEEQKAAVLAKYASVQHPGVRAALYEKAITYYDANLERIPNKRWLSVIDFSLHSKHHRFFLMDMEGGEMTSYPIAHGKNSDPNDDGIATEFGNVNGSYKSSVGYYFASETYQGDLGRSMRLDGLSATNSNVRERIIVVHGASYVVDGWPKQGKSLGCPAFEESVVQGVIEKIKDGSVIYAMN